MRRYLRCPGAICCPARRALRAVLQPHPVLRRADRRRVEPTAPSMRRLGPPAGCGGCSVRGKPGRCLRVRHRCPCAIPRGRSTGLGVAGFAIRSRRDRHRPRASPRSPNGPIRARLKPPGSPAATAARLAHGGKGLLESRTLSYGSRALSAQIDPHPGLPRLIDALITPPAESSATLLSLAAMLPHRCCHTAAVAREY